jgi:protein tyrosine kinase modulator
MLHNGEISLSEAKRIFRHYWWVLPLTIVVCATIAVEVASVLPKKYTSQTSVLVDTPTVPVEYVRPVVSQDLNQRLASMQEEILSKTRLQPIIEKFALYPQDRGRVHIENLVERLRSAVTVKPLDAMPGTSNRQLPGFYVEVTFDNPQLAQQICSEITSMFMEQNARAREQQATRTTTFLSKQLEEAKAKLDEQDGRLAQFKIKYLGSLPEQEQTNLSLLMGMNSQLEANTQALSRAQQDKAFNESLFSQQVANWKSAQTGQNPETQELQLLALQDLLLALRARYTAEHPDVIKTQYQIEELKKRMAQAPNASDTGIGSKQASTTEPPQIQQLHARLRQDDLNIADLSKQQEQIQERIRVLQGHVQASPIVEQQFKEMTRNYQSALEFYNELQKKRENSAMATDLEHQQESEQFRILDPPSLPLNPSFPKMAYFGGGGLAAGIVLGLGILYLLAASDKSMHTERDVELCLKLPVLTLVPTLETVVNGGSRQARGSHDYDAVGMKA